MIIFLLVFISGFTGEKINTVENKHLSHPSPMCLVCVVKWVILSSYLDE